MLSLKLKFLQKNWSTVDRLISLRKMSSRLNISHSALYCLLTGETKSVNPEMAQAIASALHALRGKPYVRDASLLLPNEVKPKWRFATKEGDYYVLWNAPACPDYNKTAGKWVAAGNQNHPSILIDDIFLRVPPDADTYGTTLYVRDMETLLWYKTPHVDAPFISDEIPRHWKPTILSPFEIKTKMQLYGELND